MKVREFLHRLRQLVLEHPEAANEEIVIAPHGKGHAQEIGRVHLNLHGTRIVIEAERK